MFAGVAAIVLICLGLWLSVSGNVSLADAVIDAVSQVKTVTYEILETVDGEPDKSTQVKEVIGFVCDEGPYTNLRVWVDPDTKLPVRMESSFNDESGSMVQEVICSFVYDAPIDDSLFVVRVPVDYEADVKLAASKPRELQIMPGVGVGTLRFGMTEAKVMEVLGKPRHKRPAAKGELLDYGADGLYLEVDGEEGLRVIHCISQLAYGFSVRTFSGETEKGIGIGASPQRVKAAYGEPVQEHNNRGIGLMMYVSPTATFKYREGKLAEVILVKPSVER